MHPRVLAILLLANGPALAWGPRTHGAVHDAALPGLSLLPAGRFLADPHQARLFADAGLAADLTFNLLALGKADPAYDILFHRSEFLDYLVGTARARGGDAYTFALGFAGHLPADQVGNAAASATSRNVFDWPADRDPWGRGVSDPAQSAEVQLAGVTHRLNKFLVDLLIDASRDGGPTWRDPVDVDCLVDSVRAYDGPASLPAQMRQDPERVRDDVRRFRRGFRWSLRALSIVSGHLRRNSALIRGIAAEFEGDASYLPTVQESAARVVERVRDHLEAPSRRLRTGLAHDHDTDLEQDRELIEVLDEAAKAIERGEQRLAPRHLGPENDLGAVRERIYRIFFTRILLPGARWPAVRSAVRGTVP